MRLASFISVVAILGLLAMVAVYFGWRVWENREGDRQWREEVDTLRQDGEPTAFSELAPPPVADADNLAALPFFDTQREPGEHHPQALKLKNALKNLSCDSSFPTSHWMKGEACDIDAIRKYLARCFQQTFPGQPMPPAMLGEIDALCPALNEIRQAAMSRPACRFNEDYSASPYTWPLGGITEMIALEKFLNLHAIVALHENHPDVALQDIETMLKINAGLRQVPVLVAGLVAIGVKAIGDDGLWQGLERHAWNDQQLAQLQRDLAPVDFLSDYQLCLRGEAWGEIVPICDRLRDQKLSIGARHASQIAAFWSLVPAGLLDQAKADGVSLYAEAAREVVHPSDRRLFPEAEKAVTEKATHFPRFSPPHRLLQAAVGPVIGSGTHFGVAQFRVDAERVAIMLERYRLTHGGWPATLDPLASYADDGMGLPHDLCNGEPLHYAVRPDGTYLLYSVGWNQLDDGGQVDQRTDEPKAVDEKRGDWVWPQPDHPGT